jgi:CheY-like chemotaxis protein
MVTMPARRMILVVEDDPSVQRVTRRALESFGYEAVVTEDVPSAVAATLACGGNFCCVLLDYSLKRSTAVQAIVQLKAVDGGLPVIIVSGYPREEIEASTGPLDDSRFLQKPYTLEALRDAILATRRD